jgi:hypothetical protein
MQRMEKLGGWRANDGRNEFYNSKTGRALFADEE